MIYLINRRNIVDVIQRLCFVRISMFYCGALCCSMVTSRGVATGWTGVDMSNSLLLDGVPEIDADLVSLIFWVGGWSGLELDSLPYINFQAADPSDPLYMLTDIQP